MTENATHIAGLINRHLLNALTETEQHQLDQWLALSENNRHLFAAINNGQLAADDLNIYYSYDAEKITAKINSAIPAFRISETISKQRTIDISNIFRRQWFRYAAIVVIVFGIGAYLFTTLHKEKPTSQIAHEISVDPAIVPGGNKAVLTLADGTAINLDSAGIGRVAMQNGAQVIKKADGRLEYSAPVNVPSNISYNTMSTPKGGQYELRLPDGTHVWLNAASSITYPTVFTGTTRQVSITGEAYFEVSKISHQPFLVRFNKETIIEVLGTHFNINCYDDEPNAKTTLLEGSVKVIKGKTSQILTPGQQAITKENIRIINDINVERVVAWKNGYFNLEGASVEEFMRQLARWYDLEIIYKGNGGNQTFKGKLGKDLLLPEVLETLSYFNIRYKIEGRTITIE